MFVLRIGLGRSKRLILNHIFRAVTALILMSGAAHAGDGEDLLKAAFTGDLAQVRTLLEKGADIDHQNRDGVTALILSSQQGHGWIVQALLARGAEIDIQDWLGSTALMHASGEGYEGVVQALLARGAEIDIQNRVGWTALIQASWEGHGWIVQALLAEGAEMHHQSRYGWTALIRSSENGHEGVVQALLAKGAEIDIQNKYGATAVTIASLFGNDRIVKTLLAKGANVELRARDGATALKKSKTQQIKQLLRAAGVRPLDQDLMIQVQTALLREGHDPGPIDGAWGPKTEAALREYQLSQGLDPTGRPDGVTLEKLKLTSVRSMPGYESFIDRYPYANLYRHVITKTDQPQEMATSLPMFANLFPDSSRTPQGGNVFVVIGLSFEPTGDFSVPFDKKSVYISDGTSKSYRIGMRYSLEGKWDRETGVQFGNIFSMTAKSSTCITCSKLKKNG